MVCCLSSLAAVAASFHGSATVGIRIPLQSRNDIAMMEPFSRNIVPSHRKHTALSTHNSPISHYPSYHIRNLWGPMIESQDIWLVVCLPRQQLCAGCTVSIDYETFLADCSTTITTNIFFNNKLTNATMCTQYDRLLASSCMSSVCLSVCLWRCALWLSGSV